MVSVQTFERWVRDQGKLEVHLVVKEIGSDALMYRLGCRQLGFLRTATPKKTVTGLRIDKA